MIKSENKKSAFKKNASWILFALCLIRDIPVLSQQRRALPENASEMG
jgi:hypothetical protein